MDERSWGLKLYLCLLTIEIVQGQETVCLGFNIASVQDPQPCAYNTLKLVDKRSQQDPDSSSFAIATNYKEPQGSTPDCCLYTYTEGLCFNASTHGLANRRSGPCDIQNIKKWMSVNWNIYQTFKVKVTRNGKKIAFFVLSCNDKATCLTETTTANPTNPAETQATPTLTTSLSSTTTATSQAVTPITPTITQTSLAITPTNHSINQYSSAWNITTFPIFNETTESIQFTEDTISLLVDEAAKLNPANVGDLENIENILLDVLRKQNELINTVEDHGNSQLYIEHVKWNQTEYKSSLTLGASDVNFALQTNGVRRLVVAVFVFKINTTVNAQTQPVESGSLATTQYVATLNTTYIATVGWDANSGPSSSRKRSTAEQGNNQLPGNVNFVVPPTPLKYFCKKSVTKKKHEPNLMINKLEPICLFFDRVERKYSNRGCVTITDDITGNVTCKCNHLTLFTVLLAVQSTTIPQGVKVTSYATESTSIMFLVATMVILYRSKRNGDRVSVQISLSLALLLFHVINISHDLAVLNEVTCVTVTAANHYLLLCSGMWFLVEGIRLFMATSFPIQFRTQDSSKRLKIFMLIGWMLPVIIVGMSIAAGFPLRIYMKHQPMYDQCNDFISILKYDRCWLAPGTPIFHSTVVVPLALVLLINFMIMMKTAHVMLNSQRMRIRGGDPGTGDALRAAKSFILLFLMLGGTWVLAFFTGIGNEISNEVFMYIHSLVNGSQGIVVFLLYCVIDDDVRQEMLTCKRKSKFKSEQQGNEVNSEGGECSNSQEEEEGFKMAEQSLNS